MSLTGPQLGRIHKAILAAYGRDELERVLLTCMDIEFDHVVARTDFSAQVFALVRWANRQGRALELIKCTHEEVPGNGALSALYAESQVWGAPAGTIPPAPSLDPHGVRQQARPPIEFDWVTIPAGEFLMGSDRARDERAYDDELPQHRVSLPAYRIARVPVTNAQYATFVRAAGHPAPEHWTDGRIPQNKDQHPVVYVSWHGARAFCAWASEATGASVRLPNEAEWEKAARGTDGRIWPWGDDLPTKELCNFGDKIGDTTPVSAYPRSASPYGLLDMAGNVWEWTGSLFRPYPYDASDGREDPEATGRRTLRGGGFFDNDGCMRCAYRVDDDADSRLNFIGFRVVSPGS